MAREMTMVGNASWVNYHGPDAAAARKFYVETLDLPVGDMPMKDGSTLPGIMVDGEPIGGFSPFSAQTGFWDIYFTVADVDACVKKVAAAGGEILSEPNDMPGIGRTAKIRDPQGGDVCLITYESMMA